MALSIEFGVSTWLWVSPFTTASIDPLFAKIASMGFDTVEIAVEDPTLIDPVAVARGLDVYGLKALVCGAFGPDRDLTHEDPAVQERCLRYIAACLDLCAQWKSSFLAGPMYSAVGKARMIPAEKRKQEWEQAVRNLRIVCEMAAARGLSIALEPLNRFETDLVNNVSDVVRMVGEIGHPAARVMLDSFHMSIEEPDIEAAIRLAGDRLIHVQVSENYRGIPGTGQTDWAAYRRGLEAVGYRGCVSIESFTPGNQELAGAVCIWRPLAGSQDEFASKGIGFLRGWASAELAAEQRGSI